MRLLGLRPGTARKEPVEEKRQAFEALVKGDWDRFYRFTLRMCKGNRDDAEDLLAESMVEAFQGFDTFRGGPFDRWFFRILAHNRIDMVRRQRVRHTESLEARAEDGDWEGADLLDRLTPGPEHRVLAGCYSEPVQQALDELPEEFRSVVLLCDVEGMDYQSIADTLGLPIGTVRSRLARGRERLRVRLQGVLMGQAR